jgi:hypothetical protein
MASSTPAPISNTSSQINIDLTDFDAYERSIASVTNNFASQDKFLEEITRKMEVTKGLVSSISGILQTNNDLSEAQKDTITDSVRQYKQHQISIAKARIEQKKGNMTQSEYNRLVIRGQEAYADLVKSISASGQSAQDIIPILEHMGDEMKSFNEAAKQSEKVLSAMNTTLDHIGSSGVAGMSELTTVIKSAAEGGKGLGLAIFTLGAALGALAYNYGLVGNKVEKAAELAIPIIEASGAIDVLEKQISAGKFGGRNFVQEKAMAQFASSMRSAAASFQAAAKTALFGNTIGGVGYAASQLETAGISADKIAASMKASANATGRMPTGKIGSDMAVMATRTGESEESIANINEAFERMDGMTANVAMNMQEGLRTMAKQANINLGGLISEMATATKDMLGYQIKSGLALARQVTFSKSMGISFNDVAKAGRSMVLTYKDSIKSEMQLSAMLGRTVNLSEVRAKFLAGDTPGAINALQAQGLDPTNMNMFQQELLQQTTGMDLDMLDKINKKKGASFENLQQEDARSSNQKFLNKIIAAKVTLETTNASISSDTAIVMSRLDTDEQVALKEAIVKNTAELAKAYKTKDQAVINEQIGTGYDKLLYTLAAGAGISGLFKLLKSKIPLPPLYASTPPTTSLLGTNPLDPLPTANPNPGGTGSNMRGMAKNALIKGGPVAAALAGIYSIGSSAYNVATSEAINSGKGGGLQTFGNFISGMGAEFVDVLDKVTGGFTKGLAESAGVSVRGVSTSKMEQARAAYRQQTGQQIGIGEEGNQKLVDWVIANKNYLSGKGGLDSTVKAFEESIAAGKIKTSNADAQSNVKNVIPGNTSITTDMDKWLKTKLTYMSGNLERIVTRTQATQLNTANAVTELKTLSSNTAAMLVLTKTIEALTKATYVGAEKTTITEISLDGRKLNKTLTAVVRNDTGLGRGPGRGVYMP